MFDHKVDDGLRVGKPMGMMPLVGLMDHENLTAKFPVPFFDDQRVFRRGHDIILVANDVHHRDRGLCQRSEHVDRVARIGHGGGLVGKSVSCQAGSQVFRAALARALPAGPALEVADRIIAVDHRHVIRMLSGVPLGIEAAAADANEGRLGGKATADELVMKSRQSFDRLR